MRDVHRKAACRGVVLAGLCAALTLPTTSGAADTGSSRPITPAGYFHVVRAWHTPTPGQRIARDRTGRPLLVVHAMYVGETVTLAASTDEGGFGDEDCARASHALRDPKSGAEHPIAPRTLDLLYRIQQHFEATEIRVMSAYRAPNARSTQGLHGQGRAVDFVVPGATDEEVARFARSLGFVGVGVYPVGSFVHVDTRARSYFWRDRSGPGHRSRERGILRDMALRSDADARARGETPFGEIATGSTTNDEAEEEDVP